MAAPKDYVRRGKYQSPTKKNSSSKKRKKKKEKHSPLISPLALIALFLITMVMVSLYFFKNGSNGSNSNNKTKKTAATAETTLPKKPKAQWGYVETLTNTPVSAASQGPKQIAQTSMSGLNDEQRKILSQMAKDKPETPSRLPATYNQQVSRQTTTVATTTPTNRSNTGSLADINNTPPSQRNSWYLQCGSFRNPVLADALKAQLSLEGVSSRVSAGGGWFRVLVGPYKTRQSAVTVQNRLQNSGVRECKIRD